MISLTGLGSVEANKRIITTNARKLSSSGKREIALNPKPPEALNPRSLICPEHFIWDLRLLVVLSFFHVLEPSARGSKPSKPQP